jgi:hypothetical protein
MVADTDHGPESGVGGYAQCSGQQTTPHIPRPRAKGRELVARAGYVCGSILQQTPAWTLGVSLIAVLGVCRHREWFHHLPGGATG